MSNKLILIEIEKQLVISYMTQEQQVIEAIRNNGGYSTLGNLYHLVDSSSWGTKTPQATIRRIVQQSKDCFKIQPGLWALEECRDAILTKFELKGKESCNEEKFTHGYYQGLLVEIGNMKKFTTYVPAQDQNRKFLEKPLKDVCNTIVIPHFSYESITDRAKTVDVIWFNERQMPNSFFEVEHSTDIQNSIAKFCDLEDFNSSFVIVAPISRKGQYDKVLGRTAFKSIKNRVSFNSYEAITKQYELMCEINLQNEWI